MKLIASLAPARAEIEAGVVAKADQKCQQCFSRSTVTAKLTQIEESFLSPYSVCQKWLGKMLK